MDDSYSQKIAGITSKIGLTILVLNVVFIAYLSTELKNPTGHALETFKEIRNTFYGAYGLLAVISGLLIIVNRIPKYVLIFLVANVILTTYAYFLATLLISLPS